MSSHEAVLEILVRAMINEQDGQDFYLAAVQRVTDPKGKELFQSLIRDEKDHLQILQAQYAHVSADHPFVDLSTARKQLTPKPDLQLFPAKSELKKMLAAASTDIEALKVAMEFEAKGYKMYDEAGKNSSDANARAVFAELSQQENGHYLMLEKTLGYLQDKGIWFFDEIERPMFEG